MPAPRHDRLAAPTDEQLQVINNIAHEAYDYTAHAIGDPGAVVYDLSDGGGGWNKRLVDRMATGIRGEGFRATTVQEVIRYGTVPHSYMVVDTGEAEDCLTVDPVWQQFYKSWSQRRNPAMPKVLTGLASQFVSHAVERGIDHEVAARIWVPETAVAAIARARESR